MRHDEVHCAEPCRLKFGSTPGLLGLVVSALLGCALATAAFAQGRPAMGGGFTPGFAGGPRMGGGLPPAAAAPRAGIVGGFRHHPQGPRSRSGTVFLGSPYWYDDGWYDSSRYVTEQPQPGAERAPSREPAPPATPAQALMIERQGDRFVRLTNAQVNPAMETVSNGTAGDRERLTNPTRSSNATAPVSDEIPAVLVFRDGHQQDVVSYSIIGGTLYESASYYSSGYWTKKIQLAELDLPATQKLNRQRGVHFVLPGGPNQIVTRP
jgi:hypothetical protein